MRIPLSGWRIFHNMTSDPSRFLKGRAGENAATEFYLRNGYEIVARNWRWRRKGEIDIIAYNKETGTIAICEVKTRGPQPLVRPCESVNAAKQKKLRTLTEVYLLQNPGYLDVEVRFDVVEVILEYDGVSQLNFIENAF